MPNCDFYATPEDHHGILDWLFADGSCDVYELASEFELPLRQFQSGDEILQQFERRHKSGEPWTAVHLQLYLRSAGPPFLPRRVSLSPAHCGGATFRFVAEGWGLIQLYLHAAKGDWLEDSHTNHNSAKRAESWASTCPEMGEPAAWDFPRITSFSSKLNREIRKRAVGKISSRVILPGAMQAWDAGIALWPWRPGEHQLDRRD